MTASSLFDLFHGEMEHHVRLLRTRILALAQSDSPVDVRADPDLGRAYSSIRGALRVVGLQSAEPLLDAVEAVLEDASSRAASAEAAGRSGPAPWTVKALLDATDLLGRIGRLDAEAASAFPASHEAEMSDLRRRLRAPSVPAPAAPPPERPGKVREMFQSECAQHGAALEDALLALEREPSRSDLVDKAMRAAHSLKGAARVVGLEAAVRLAHAVEEHALRMQRGTLAVTSDGINLALRAGDLLGGLGAGRDVPDAELVAAAAAIEAAGDGSGNGDAGPRPAPAAAASASRPEPPDAGSSEVQRVLRVRASQISLMVGLAGESLVEARRLGPLLHAQHRLRSRQSGLADLLDDIHQALGAPPPDHPVGVRVSELRARISECRDLLASWVAEFEEHARRSEELTLRMYQEATASRMRPLSDGLTGFARLTRDLTRQLGKSAELHVQGDDIEIDRDILEKIEAPLVHILRNCLDHGIERPEERRAAGKPATGLVRIEARHRSGTILLDVSDDGRGIDGDKVRRRIAELGLLPDDQARDLADARLYDYIFAPGFSTSDVLTDVSGRGVGLDVVQSVLHSVGGSVYVTSEPGRGTAFHLSLPVSRSVVRCVVVAIAGEPYAFPLARIDRLVTLPLSEVRLVEDRQYVLLEERSVAVVPTAQMLELPEPRPASESVHLLVASDRAQRFAFVVDRFVGELDLVVRPLDPRLGRVADVGAMAILPDGGPVLVVDVDDLVRSVVRLSQVARIEKIEAASRPAPERRRRILVVDDSFTVRELERHLLARHGYDVVVAVDGLAAWSAVRDEHYDLVVTDVDMPRMDGVALTRSIKQDARLRDTPVVIVSYRDSPSERARGLQAAADAYLGKTDFDDERLVQVVRDLVGDPVP